MATTCPLRGAGHVHARSSRAPLFALTWICRRKLIEDLDVYADQQKKNGLVVTSYWLAGSFVSSKTSPGDIGVPL